VFFYTIKLSHEFRKKLVLMTGYSLIIQLHSF